MAIPYYRFFPGDYARDTRHLSLTQHGVYRLLIDLYMDTGGPLRNDLGYLHRWLHAESIEEKNALEFVLGEFFLLRSNKWTHKRCDVEIGWRISQSEAGRRAVNARKLKHLDTGVDRSIIERPSYQNQNQNQNQRSTRSKSSSTATTNATATSKTAPRKRGSELTVALPDWIPAEHWNAWIEARTKRRNPPTEWACQLAIAKLETLKEDGHHPAAVLAQSAFRGWAGLFPVKEDR